MGNCAHLNKYMLFGQLKLQCISLIPGGRELQYIYVDFKN